MSRRELEKLIALYLEGRCNEQQAAQLLEALDASEESRLLMARHVYHEKSIEDLMRLQVVEDAAEDLGVMDHRQTPSGEELEIYPFTRRRSFAAAAAALLAVSATLAIWLSQPEALVLARVAQGGAGVHLWRGGEREPALGGESMHAGDRLETRTGAEAEILYEDGTRLFLRPRSTVRLEEDHGAKHVHLEHGGVTADVAKQPIGLAMRLHTPNTHTTVLGTRFTLSTLPGRSLIEVDHGHVSFERAAGHDRLDVKTGEYALLEQGVDPMHGPLDRLVARWPFDEGFGQITRDASGRGHGGVISGAQWVQAVDGAALRFNGVSSRMMVRTTPSLNAVRNAVTLAVSTWPEIGGEIDQTLAARMTDDGTQTLYHLGLRDGRPVFRVMTGTGPASVVGPPLVLGRWSHLAGVYDGVRLTLYVDGNAVAHAVQEGDFQWAKQPLLFGAALRDGKVVDHYRGSLRDVRLYARALGGREVRALAGPTSP